MKRRTWALAAITVASVLTSRMATPAVADCDDDGGLSDYRVCATWASGDPEHGVDYEVAFNDPLPPDVELFTGNDAWTIYVQHTSDDSPADLGILSVADPGNFTVKLQGPGNTPGAVDVYGMTLEPSGNFRSSLANGSRISGDLGAGGLTLKASSGGGGALYLTVDGSVVNNGNIAVPVLKSLLIGGDLNGNITVTTSTDGALAIGHDVNGDSYITLEGVTSNAAVNLSLGPEGGTFWGEVVLESDLPAGAVLSIGRSTELTGGVVDFQQNDLNGLVNFVFGGIHMITDVGDVGGFLFLSTSNSEGAGFFGAAEVDSISTNGAILVQGGDLKGEIVVADDLAGAIQIEESIVDDSGFAGSVEVGGDMPGRIIVFGSLEDAIEGDEISIAGSLGTTGAVTINHKGYEYGAWGSGASVGVGVNTYTGNTPAARVWEVTSCKGDMNNDGSVDAFDIDGFVDAVEDPGAYATAFPGLEGSMIWHADFGGAGGSGDQCEGEVDGKDIDFFIERVFDACCDPACGFSPCASFGPGGSPTPEQTAEMLEAALDSTDLDAWVAMIQEALTSMSPERQDFWEDVLGILGYE